MAEFIRAECRAYNVALHGAQLTAAIVDAKHTAKGAGGVIYIEDVVKEIAQIRAELATIEEALGLTTAAPETEAA